MDCTSKYQLLATLISLGCILVQLGPVSFFELETNRKISAEDKIEFPGHLPGAPLARLRGLLRHRRQRPHKELLPSDQGPE